MTYGGRIQRRAAGLDRGLPAPARIGLAVIVGIAAVAGIGLVAALGLFVWWLL